MNIQLKSLRGEYKQTHIGYNRNVSIIRLVILTIFLLMTAISCATTPSPGKPVVKETATMKRDLGEANIMQGDYTTALRELLAAAEMNPNDPITHNYLGIVYKNKKQTDQAILHFKKAIDIKPGYSQAKNNLGAAYMDMGDWDAAITCFKELSEDLLYATPHFPLANLGWAYYNKKDYQQAEMYYQKAIEVQPNFIIALNGLGQTYLAMGKYPDAIHSFEKAVQFEPRFPWLNFQLAQAYELAGQHDKARLSYGRVIELAPNTDLARDAAEARDRVGGAK
jgi:Tfp pilus assembly protein PilF